MPINLTDDPSSWPGAVQVPVGTDARTAASVHTPFQTLANRSAYNKGANDGILARIGALSSGGIVSRDSLGNTPGPYTHGLIGDQSGTINYSPTELMPVATATVILCTAAVAAVAGSTVFCWADVSPPSWASGPTDYVISVHLSIRDISSYQLTRSTSREITYALAEGKTLFAAYGAGPAAETIPGFVQLSLVMEVTTNSNSTGLYKPTARIGYLTVKP